MHHIIYDDSDDPRSVSWGLTFYWHSTDIESMVASLVVLLNLLVPWYRVETDQGWNDQSWVIEDGIVDPCGEWHGGLKLASNFRAKLQMRSFQDLTEVSDTSILDWNAGALLFG